MKHMLLASKTTPQCHINLPISYLIHTIQNIYNLLLPSLHTWRVLSPNVISNFSKRIARANNVLAIYVCIYPSNLLACSITCDRIVPQDTNEKERIYRVRAANIILCGWRYSSLIEIQINRKHHSFSVYMYLCRYVYVCIWRSQKQHVQSMFIY